MVQQFDFRKILSLLVLLSPISLVSGSLILNINLIFISLFFFLAMFFNDEIRIYLKTDWFLISFIFFLLQIFSALINEINFNSIIRSLGFLKFFIYALSLVVVFNYKEKYFNYYLKITFFIFCFIILDSLIQYKFGQNLFGVEYVSERLTSIFIDEKIVGSYLSKIAFLVTPIYLMFIKKFKFSQVLLFIWFLLIAVTILLSGERMASLIIIFAITLFYTINSFKDFKQIIPILIFFFIIFIASYNNETISKRFKEITHEKYGVSKDLDIKNSVWGAHFLTGYEIFKDNIFFGAGPKNFRIESCKKKYEKIESSRANQRCSTHPHNIVLELLSEHGIFGFMSFILIIYFVLKDFKIINNYNLFYFLALLIYIWPIGTSGSIFTTWNGTFLWINIGLISFLKSKKDG